MRAGTLAVALLLTVLPSVRLLATDHPVAAELLVATLDRAAGEARVGVLLTMQPGWHVYWVNPGDAGLATSVELQLPPGVQAGAIEWPLPSRFTDPGDIVTFGYHGSTLLASDLRFTPGATEPVTIAAEVAWLACKKVCLLGEASLTGTLDPTTAPSPKVSRLLAEWRQRLPASQGQTPPFRITATGGLDGITRSGTVTAWLSWPERRAAAAVDCFPLPLDGVTIGQPDLQSRGGLTRIDLPVSAEHQVPDRLPVLIVLGTGSQQAGYQVQVPVPGRSS